MQQVKRYKMYRDHWQNCSCDIDENDKGEWVLYEDIKHLLVDKPIVKPYNDLFNLALD